MTVTPTVYVTTTTVLTNTVTYAPSVTVVSTAAAKHRRAVRPRGGNYWQPPRFNIHTQPPRSISSACSRLVPAWTTTLTKTRTKTATSTKLRVVAATFTSTRTAAAQAVTRATTATAVSTVTVAAAAETVTVTAAPTTVLAQATAAATVTVCGGRIPGLVGGGYQASPNARYEYASTPTEGECCARCVFAADCGLWVFTSGQCLLVWGTQGSAASVSSTCPNGLGTPLAIGGGGAGDVGGPGLCALNILML